MSVNNLGNKIHYTQGADLASATNLPVVLDGDYFNITGTTSISSMDTMGIGMQIVLHFNDALILIHSAEFDLPGDSDITTDPGDDARFIEYEIGKWRCVSYSRYNVIPGGEISDASYGAAWNGVTTVGASKNALYDKIETLADNGVNTDITALQGLDPIYYNIIIGETTTGAALTTGWQNILLGLNAGNKLETGARNIAIGTQALELNVSNSNNIAVGYKALGNSTADANIAIGDRASEYNTTGINNTAVGIHALTANQTGSYNTAVGYEALTTTTATRNTAIGWDSLTDTTTGGYNTAVGQHALSRNTEGTYNVALGRGAGYNHADGSTPLITPECSVYIGAQSKGKDDADDNSIVIGYNAIGEGANTTVIGNSNTVTTHLHGDRLIQDDGDDNIVVGDATTGDAISTGTKNVVVGANALTDNSTGAGNTAMGDEALRDTTASSNTGIGGNALGTNTLGNNNVAVGHNAGLFHADGITALTDPENSIYIGKGTRGKDNADDNSTVIGYNAIGKGTNTTVIGNTSTTDTYINTKRVILDNSSNIVLADTSASAGTAITTGWQNVIMGTNTATNLVDGYRNIAIGTEALEQNVLGDNNVAIGWQALEWNKVNENIGIGAYAAKGNSIGEYNTAIGTNALAANQTGSDNTALGYYAAKNLSSSMNTAIGCYALSYTTDGQSNTAVGAYAANGNTAGTNNTAIGTNALTANQTGSYNTALGYDAAKSLTSSRTTAIGWNALGDTTTGQWNTAVGQHALSKNITGDGNTVIGQEAGFYQADAATPLTTANNSVYIGRLCKGKDNLDSNSIVIGYNAIGKGISSVVLGNDNITNTYLKGIVNLANSGQIKFPTIQNASTNANIMDDYEEGTFLPYIYTGSITMNNTYYVQLGTYQKVGRWVNIVIQLSVNLKGLNTGTLTIAPLPFAPDLSQNTPVPIFSAAVSFYYSLKAYLHPDDSRIYLCSAYESGSIPQLTSSNIVNGSYLYLNFSYRATA